MSRLRLAALSLVLIALAACTHGLELEGGERPVQSITRINFLFSEGQNDILLNPPESAVQPERTVDLPQPAAALTGTPTSAPTRSTIPTPTGSGQSTAAPGAEPTSTGAAGQSTPTAAPTQLPEVDVAAITANDTAESLAIPATEVDPGLETIDEANDPSEFLAEQLMAESGLISFYVTGSSRQPTSGTAAGRPVQLVQRLFVHANQQGAATMFRELADSAAPTFAIAALGFFRQFYPDLEPTSRTSDQFSLADENRLIEVRIDPMVEPAERELGPGDPHIYYLVLRQGRVTALFELVFLSTQEPGTVTVLGERLIKRIPSDLAEPQPANA